jgi:hypothetical protein
LSKLDENVELAEDLFNLSEEVREMVNTLEVGKQRIYIIQALVKCLEGIEKTTKFYKITREEIESVKFVEEDYDNMEF